MILNSTKFGGNWTKDLEVGPDRQTDDGQTGRFLSIKIRYHISESGVMANLLTSSAVYRGFEPCLGQTNEHKMSICCNFAKQEDLRSKNWPIQNQDNVSEWNDISTGGLLVQ
jgi:hypothetical protein